MWITEHPTKFVRGVTYPVWIYGEERPDGTWEGWLEFNGGSYMPFARMDMSDSTALIAGCRIDISVRHPKQPGTFLCGLECDGATYHGIGLLKSSPTQAASLPSGLTVGHTPSPGRVGAAPSVLRM